MRALARLAPLLAGAALVAAAQTSCNGTCIDYIEYYRCDCVRVWSDREEPEPQTFECARDETQARQITEYNCGTGSYSCRCSCTETAEECPDEGSGHCR